MCLAIYKPKGKIIPEDYLDTAWSNNKDGAGFAVVVNGRLEIHRGFMVLDDFLEAWKPHRKRQAIIHFRWATHGARDASMTHPFRVSRNVAMIHNGCLRIQTSGNNSDTYEYVLRVLAPLGNRDEKFWMKEPYRLMGEDAISGSKFCFLHADGTYGIWNAGAGHWLDGCWYSNHGYEQVSAGYRWYNPKDRKATVVPDTVKEQPSLVAYAESQYYSSMPKDLKWKYEDLLEEGWEVDDLDDIHSLDPENGLEQLHAAGRQPLEEEDIDARDTVAQ